MHLHSITKRYSGATALKNVSFTVQRGEIHALLGANGAGKSTLVKIICGVIEPDEGAIILDHENVKFHNPSDAISHGISYVPQELSLVPTMSVCQNILLGQEPSNKFFSSLINERELEKIASEMLSMVDLNVDIHQRAGDLPVSAQQMISIATAVYRNSKIIILDEPTSSLSSQEINKLFEIMKQLRKEGLSIIFITHHLEEVFEISDRITILRDAEYQGSFKTDSISREEIVSLMTGKAEQLIKRKPQMNGQKFEAIRLNNVNTEKISKNISFTVYKGEVVGLFGQVGAGRTEVLRSIFGADKVESGEIFIFGNKVEINSPIEAIDKGIGFITEDRKNQGLVLTMDLIDNINLGIYGKSIRLGLIQSKSILKITDYFVNALRIKTSNLKTWTKFLSGGNQQKVILAKWLNHESKILLMDEPTKGIDVGAKQEFYQLINDLSTTQKVAILLVTSELSEVIALCDRILVFKQGQIVTEVDPDSVTEEELMAMTL